MQLRYILMIVAMVALFLSGCAKQSAIQHEQQASSNFEYGVDNAKPGQGQRPPLNHRTKRIEMGYVGVFKVSYWDTQTPKAPAIQKWRCKSFVRYNAIFQCKEDALAFLASANRDRDVASWKSLLDSQKPMTDPSREGAFQVYMGMPMPPEYYYTHQKRK